MYRMDASADRSILIVAYSAQVFGIDRMNGQIVWHQRISHTGMVVEFAIVEQVVVALCGDKLLFLDYRSGHLHKAVTLPASTARPTMLVDGQQVVIAVDGKVLCYTTTGDHVWLQPFTGHGYGTIAVGLPGNIRQADYR